MWLSESSPFRNAWFYLGFYLKLVGICSFWVLAVTAELRDNASVRRVPRICPVHVPCCKILCRVINLSSSPAVRVPGEAGNGAVPSVTLWHAVTDHPSQVDITNVTSASMSWHPQEIDLRVLLRKTPTTFLHLAGPYGATIKGDEGFITAAAEWQLSVC